MTVTSAATDTLANDAPRQTPKPATVAEAVARFRAFRRKPLASIFAALPWALLGLGVIVETLRVLTVSGARLDLMFASGTVAAALAVRLMGASLARFPRALAGLWERDLLSARDDAERGEAGTEARLVAFLDESEARLNHPLGLLCGFGGAVAMAVLFWPFQVGTLGDWAWALASEPRAWLGVLFYFVVYGLGFAAGYVIWRPIALAIRLARFGAVFDFDILDHPDGCGGLKPVGDLGLGIALIAAGPTLFFGGWALTLSAFPASSFVGLNELKLLFAGLAALWVCLSLAGFFWPLWGVSRAMRRRRAQMQARLESLDRQIHQLARSLLENAERLDLAEGRAQEEKLDFLRRVYLRNRRAPVWPFNTATLLILLALQLVPLAGLTAALLTL